MLIQEELTQFEQQHSCKIVFAPGHVEVYLPAGKVDLTPFEAFLTAHQITSPVQWIGAGGPSSPIRHKKRQRKKDVTENDDPNGPLRKEMTFFRSAYLCGSEIPEGIDDTIESLLNLLSGENLCMMSVENVIVTPVTLGQFPEADPRRTQYVVTVLAKSVRGYPRHIPQSRQSYNRMRDDKQKRGV